MEASRPTRDSIRSTADTIRALLDVGRSDDPALSAPNRSQLSYAGLRDQVESTVAALNLLGIGHNDRVAIVLPNGPELASAFVGVAAGASAAPLNPAYREDDFRFYLSDLGAKALLVGRDSASPAIAVAHSLHIPVLRLEWRGKEPAGMFSIVGERVGAARSDGFGGANDIGLVLHTSGTTSRPKIVPLSQGNLTTSAGHIVETLRLSPADRCLNIMPLFHIHGLVAGVLSSLAAGASVFCPPGFNVLQFFHWMAEANPTWYTAVPTMHQAILARSDENRGILDQVRLRFIRSSSAALPPAVMRNLEQTFNVPVIESYGMTEAAHQMASNPLPPAVRKPGTVGLAAGPEIAIMDPENRLLPAGATGEVVIRGPNVAAAYENNPEANAAAFTDGWFRTGDEGVLDEDGYLTITGRLKEIINRGGEKIAPREVDDVLMDHPDVAAATTFPVPHPTLGEEVAAAVVAKQGARLTESALIEFLHDRLTAFKVPRQLVFIDEIPKGPTGKIQRHKLAAALGLNDLVDSERAANRTEDRPPTPLEVKLQELWRETLGLDHIGLHQNFFLLGGDSLQGVELLTLVENKLGHALPQSVLIEHGSVAGMAAYIEKDEFAPCVVPIQPMGDRPPFFCVHGATGGVLGFLQLVRHMGNNQPFYGIQSVGLDGKQVPLKRIEDMAAHYLREVRGYQPLGPYYLGGYSMGGIVAYEMTRQLRAAGESVALLALIDTYSGVGRRLILGSWLRFHWRNFAKVSFSEMGSYLAQRLRNVTWRVLESIRRRLSATREYPSARGGRGIPEDLRLRILEQINETAVRAYPIAPCDCDAVLLKGELRAWDHPDLHDGWRALVRGDLEIRTISGGHWDIIAEPHVRTLAAELADCLEQRSCPRLRTSGFADSNP
jgi:acyl-CoA synthetase (AMP-forming)/AMP-acid ligase II/thioesterase domain-containing protein/acyl carrier protein